jgi:hypothetical protein
MSEQAHPEVLDQVRAAMRAASCEFEVPSLRVEAVVLRVYPALRQAIHAAERERVKAELLSEAARLEDTADKMLDSTRRSLRLLRAEAIKEAVAALNTSELPGDEEGSK